MFVQYLIAVKDKDNIEFLHEYGKVIHISKSRNFVIIQIEAGKGILEKILDHSNVVSGKESGVIYLT